MELEKFKEYCKTITRKDFLEDCDKNSFSEYEIICPDEVGLLEDCSKKCLDCWQNAVKDIKFKGEEEMDNKSVKTYKTPNAYEKLSYDKSLKLTNKKGIYLITTPSGRFAFVNKEGNGINYNPLINEEWSIVQKSVGFMTAVKSGKKIRLEHILTSHLGVTKKYLTLKELFDILSYSYPSDAIGEIITEGKFYIEEDV